MKVVLRVLAGMVIAGSVRSAPPVTFNTHSVSTTEPADSRAAEAAFLQAVANGGFATIGEDFEDPVWAITRAPGAAASVTHQGITWHSSPGHQLRTVSDSDSYDIPPPFMVYAHDPASGLHPVPNTLIGDSAATLYGIGMWMDGTGTKGKVKVLFDETVEVKFQRVVGYDPGDPPDPPEPIFETVRLDYAKEFFGVYVPDGFRTFQLLEFAGEFDEVVLMWARTFTFAVPPEPVLRLTGMERLPEGLVIDVLAEPAFSNLTLQGNDTAIDPGAWTVVPGEPVSVGPNAFRLVAPLPTGPVTLYRIIADVREVLP